MKYLAIIFITLGLTACSSVEFFPKDQKAKIDIDGRCERDCIVPFVKFPF